MTPDARGLGPTSDPSYCPDCGAPLDSDSRFCGRCGAPAAAAPPSPTLGRYQVVGVVGRGATGTVYLATDPATHQRVAVKLLDPALTAVAGVTERLRAEARALAELSSPHLVAALGVEEDGGRIFLVMEYVEGASLRAVERLAGRLTPEQAFGVVAGALRGLGRAHMAGMVHGDVKPENIVVDQEGTSRLVDFGQVVSTGATTLGGTPAYMSPEAARGLPLDARSDLYAMGVVLYEALAGTLPFRAPNDLALARLQAEEPPPPIPGLPDQVAFLLDRTLAKDPADRPESAEVLLAELERAVASAYGTEWRLRAGVAALAAGVAVGLLDPVVPAAGAPLPPAVEGSSAFQGAADPWKAGPGVGEQSPTADGTRAPRSGFLAAHPVLSALVAVIVIAAAITGVVVAGGRGTKPGTTTGAAASPATRSTATPSPVPGEASPAPSALSGTYAVLATDPHGHYVSDTLSVHLSSMSGHAVSGTFKFVPPVPLASPTSTGTLSGTMAWSSTALQWKIVFQGHSVSGVSVTIDFSGTVEFGGLGLAGTLSIDGTTKQASFSSFGSASSPTASP